MSCVPCVRAGEAKLRGSASAVMIPPKVGVGGRICVASRGVARPVPGRFPERECRDDPSEARGRRAKVYLVVWRGVAWRGRCSAGARPVPGARVP